MQDTGDSYALKTGILGRTAYFKRRLKLSSTPNKRLLLFLRVGGIVQITPKPTLSFVAIHATNQLRLHSLALESIIGSSKLE